VVNSSSCRKDKNRLYHDVDVARCTRTSWRARSMHAKHEESRSNSSVRPSPPYPGRKQPSEEMTAWRRCNHACKKGGAKLWIKVEDKKCKKRAGLKGTVLKWAAPNRVSDLEVPLHQASEQART
jgi:hypothetical protein